MRVKYLFIIFYALIFSPLFCYGAFVEKGKWSRPQALGSAYCGISDDMSAPGWNPGGLAQKRQSALSASYTQLFSMNELGYELIGIMFSGKKIGQFGFTYSKFGNKIYEEKEIIFTHSLSLKGRIFFGYNLSMKTLGIFGYGKDSTLSVDGGLLARLNSRCRIGIASFNINHAKISGGNEILPQSFRMGISYSPFDDLLLAADIYKQIGYPIEIGYGMEYKLFPILFIRCGIKTLPARFSSGIGFVWKIFEMDYTVITHPQLPLEHHFTFTLKS